MPVSQITDISTYEGFTRRASSLVVIKYSNKWHTQCKTSAASFEALSDKSDYALVKFAELDVDTIRNDETPTIKTCPTFILFKDKKEKTRIVGANMAAIEKAIKAHM